jgi:signal transduction histidine kinase
VTRGDVTRGRILTLELRLEHDVVLARQRARQISALLGFDTQDQTRIATAVSEMARNAYKYAGGGRVEFSVGEAPPTLLVRVSDSGPGIRDLEAVLDGHYQSETGMGVGIIGTRRLMDVFEIRSQPGAGTEVVVGKHFPRRGGAPSREQLARVADELARQRPNDPMEEVQQQNQELLRTLDEVRRQREELAQVNRELEETNRGVVALYAELDERADYLQRANEIKTRFLSNMTHEFRTPLNSIISLTRLLLQRLDGDLTSEQEKQIRFIQKSADSLGELVNDLLDLAKVEAGKIVVRPAEFRVQELFGTLRGMLRPLLAQNSAVELVFEEPQELPPMNTDESKVSQILRNFISNALKYTERGEVRVSARLGAGNTVIFAVSDTGIGIAEEDQDRVFEEYSQVDNPLQRRVRGTGLGLPLARRLAGLLGGSIGVESRLGRGSKFFAIIPATFHGPTEVSFIP